MFCTARAVLALRGKISDMLSHHVSMSKQSHEAHAPAAKSMTKLRTVPCTVKPCASSACTVCSAINPVAPVMAHAEEGQLMVSDLPHVCLVRVKEGGGGFGVRVWIFAKR